MVTFAQYCEYNTAELYTSEQLKWQISCDTYLPQLKHKGNKEMD